MSNAYPPYWRGLVGFAESSLVVTENFILHTKEESETDGEIIWSLIESSQINFKNACKINSLEVLLFNCKT